MHIRDAIQCILEYTSAGESAFLADKKTQDAVIRNLEIMGEAAKHLAPSFKDEHPDIPWKSIAGTRDKVIHEYFGVDLNLVWDIIENQLPLLKAKIDKLLT
jgi:uncharacterized protein with HEPN domain